MWKGRQWNQNTLSRDKRRNETKTFIYSPLLLIWQFYFEQKSWDIASLRCLIIQQNSTKLSELFPGQWQFLILDNDVLWSSSHRRPLKQTSVFPPSAVTSDISSRTSDVSWHHLVPGSWHRMMSQVLPRFAHHSSHSFLGSDHQPVPRQGRL